MSKPACKANASPCGAVCPERNLPGCRKVCEKWQTYEAAQLKKYNGDFPSAYKGVSTKGSIRRADNNALIRAGKKKGW